MNDPSEPRSHRPGIERAGRPLRRRLAAVLFDPRVEPARLVPRLRELGTLERHDACAAALEALAGIELPEADAESLLVSVSAHREELGRRLGRDPGLAVALADYLGNVTEHMPDAVFVDGARLERSERDALVDPLTGLSDRQTFLERLGLEIRRARRFAGHVAVATLDLDSFQPVNEIYGRPLGDRVLRRAAELLRGTVRESDLAARTAGDEFSVILPHTGRLGAFLAAERARARLASQFLSRAVDGRVVAMTVSGGVACFPGDADTAPTLLAAALRALRRAKARGGNQVVMHPEEKRRAPRWPLRRASAVTLVVRPGSMSAPAKALELSERGALVEAPFECERFQAVTLVLGSREGKHEVPAWVVRIEREGRVALALERPLPPAVLAREIGSRLPEGGAGKGSA